MNAARTAILLVLALALTVFAVGCGEEEELHVIEGEPLELGELRYNVQITRFLNADDAEDQGYLVGQEPPEPGEDFLAVFLTIDNESEESVDLPYAFRVHDTLGTEYTPVDSGSDYAIQLPGSDEESLTGVEEGQVEALQPSTLPPGGEIPVPDSTAAEGVIGGAMLLFLVDEEAANNRPLTLEIPGPAGEVGSIELDI